MKKLLAGVLSLALLAGCSSTTSTETSSETVAPTQASETTETIDVVADFVSTFTSAPISDHNLLLDNAGVQDLYGLSSAEEFASLATGCDIDQATIDQQVELRSNQHQTIFDGLNQILSEISLTETDKQALTNEDIIIRLDVNTSSKRYALAFYQGGFASIKEIYSGSENWYTTDESQVEAITTLINDNYVIVSADNADQLTCWELATLQ